jgi:GcrA cell cycle regulator
LQFRLSEIKLDFHFGISEIERVVPEAPACVSPASREDDATGNSGFAYSTRPGTTQTHAPATQESEKHRMQSTSWTPEHSSALREHLAKGMSYSEVAEAINAKFNTAYTRHAAIGRARRLGVLAAARPGDSSRLAPKTPPSSTRKMRERYASLSGWIMPVFEREETVKLRCVETDPRHLTLLELEPGDCRFPYGGDQEGEAITFCGQPCCEHSSYCAPHFHLTRGPGSPLKRPASTVALRLVEAA